MKNISSIHYPFEIKMKIVEKLENGTEESSTHYPTSHVTHCSGTNLQTTLPFNIKYPRLPSYIVLGKRRYLCPSQINQSPTT